MMKKKFLITFAIALFVVVLAMVSSALSVDYCNLSFKDSIYIKYAVDADSADVKLLVWTEPQTDYTYGTEDDVLTAKGTENINGTDYYIFDYTKLAARQMTDYVYARAYVESTDSYSDTVKYSVLTYAYNTEPTIVVNSVNAVAGKENVEVVVELFNNPGIGAMSIMLEYDEDSMSLISAKNGNALVNADGFSFMPPANTNSGMNYSWWNTSATGLPNKELDGILLTLEFNISQEATGELPITFSYLEADVIDFENGTPIELNILDGGIIIS